MRGQRAEAPARLQSERRERDGLDHPRQYGGSARERERVRQLASAVVERTMSDRGGPLREERWVADEGDRGEGRAAEGDVAGGGGRGGVGGGGGEVGGAEADPAEAATGGADRLDADVGDGIVDGVGA